MPGMTRQFFVFVRIRFHLFNPGQSALWLNVS